MHFEVLECRRHFSVTLMGDADGNGKIDGGDYSLIDNGFNTKSVGWENGDFNGDGKVDGTDYSLIDSAFVSQGTPSPKTYAVRPGDKIQDVANIVAPGDIVDILPGTYDESVNVPTQGIEGSIITFHGFNPSNTIVDGSGQLFAWSCGNYIAVDGITFNGAANPLQTGGVIVGSFSTLSNSVIQNCDSGALEMRGGHITITNVIAQNNGEIGFKAAGVSDISLINCTSRYNNTGIASPNWAGQPKTVLINGLWYVSPQFEAGGGKFAYADNILVDGLQCYGNIGHQFDFDINDSNITVQNSSFHDAGWINAVYEAMGLNVEVSNGPVVVQNNTFENDRGNGLSIQTASNIQVLNNTFNNRAAIGISNWNRGDGWSLGNIVITGNTINNSQVVSDGNTLPWDDTILATLNIAIVNNTWVHMPPVAFQWDTTNLTLDQAMAGLGIS